MLKMKPKKLRVLVIGSGGREHALVRKLKGSPRVSELFCAPGNAGIGNDATLVPIKATEIAKLVTYAEENRIDLTVVGPEAPLAAGIVDTFRRNGLAIFGPTAAAARLEGSKAFCAGLLEKYHIPHPKSVICADPGSAKFILERSVGPVVIKADGLASGKGVFIVRSFADACAIIERIMVKRELGDAGKRVVIQDFLEGREASCMVITDGTKIIPLPLSRDYKPANPGKDAPMTGGMGAYSPLPDVSPQLEEQILETIIRPAIRGMAKDGQPFTGVLYAGLMLTKDGPRVLEFNCRFGDPETQVVLARLNSDLADILWAAAIGTLSELPPPEWSPDNAVCVVAASKGYPGKPKTGYIIEGLKEAEADLAGDNVQILHASTTTTESGDCVTSDEWGIAREETYRALRLFSFPGMWYRRDIAEDAQVKT